MQNGQRLQSNAVLAQLKNRTYPERQLLWLVGERTHQTLEMMLLCLLRPKYNRANIFRVGVDWQIFD